MKDVVKGDSLGIIMRFYKNGIAYKMGLYHKEHYREYSLWRMDGLRDN